MAHNPSIEIIARAVILSGNQLLVCQVKDTDWCFLPGGHVDFGEPTEAALVREVREELGIPAVIGPFLGAVENLYGEDGEKHHEINLVFSVQADTAQLTSQEGHIRFSLVDVTQLSGLKLLPAQLKRSLISWFSDQKPFWMGGTANVTEQP